MKKIINIALLIMAIMLYFLYNMTSSSVFFAGGTLCALPSVIDLFKEKGGALKSFTLIVAFGSLLNMVVTSYGFGGTIIFIVNCGITYSCLKHLKVIFPLALVICLWLVAFLYYQMFVEGASPGDIFLEYGLSKNYPGSMLVIFNCLWAVWKYLHYHKMPLVLPILSTIMAFFLDGRSSLICMVLLTVFCFVFRGKKLTILMFVVFIGLLAYYWSSLVELYDLSTVSTRGLDTDRSIIWRAYFNNLDFSSILFGLDTDNLPILKEWYGNPHNSYLSFHRRMGLLGVIALFCYILKSFGVLIKKKYLVVVFMIFVLLVRMFFDGMLTTAEDFFILTVIFLPLSYKNDVYQIEKQLGEKGTNRIERLWDKIVFII